jgi:hypothetical protein
MKRIISVILLIGFAIGTVDAAVGARHSEQAGGFSFQAPAGWQFREFPGMKFQIALGTPENEFAPNINVVDEEYQGSLQSYVDGNLETLRKVVPGFVLVNRHPFATKSGLQGEAVVAHTEQYNKLLRQTFYFIPGTNGKYFVVSCSALKEGGEKLDSTFEESVKTFEFIK